ncbi:MAG: hypothetical protein Kow00123_18440 [Anaerolineales bacterium]
MRRKIAVRMLLQGKGVAEVAEAVGGSPTSVCRWKKALVEGLPVYAPDLNPVEMVWNHVRYAALATPISDDVSHLHRAITCSLSTAQGNPALLR